MSDMEQLTARMSALERIRNWVEHWASGERGFGRDVYDYLAHPIRLEDEQGEPLFAYVRLIEKPERPTEGTLRFFFDVRRSEDPHYAGPRIARANDPEALPFPSRTSSGDKPQTVLWYVFSSVNSLEQNDKNLRDFVRSHLKTASRPGRIDPSA
jgi:hypothetical protein